MANRKLSRRDVLRGAAAGSAGLLIATGQGLPAFAQEAAARAGPAAGRRRQADGHPPHRVFRAGAERVPRDGLPDFAAANDAELDISTTNPKSFGDFLGKMTAAVKAGNPPDIAYTSNVSISQMQLLDLRRGRHRRGRRGRQRATATSCRASTPTRSASSTAGGRPSRSSAAPPATSSAATS